MRQSDYLTETMTDPLTQELAEQENELEQARLESVRRTPTAMPSVDWDAFELGED